jgi:mxaL protein
MLSWKKNKDTLLLTCALALVIVAMLKPTIPLKHNIYSYLLVADISQSMNAIDMTLDGKPASRIAYTQKLMHDAVSSLPCGTKVSIGLFAGEHVAALYTPIEVCENFAAIQDTIDHLDWRAGWSGNSRVRGSLYSIAKTVRGFPEPAQVVFFTDGEEAPKLHVFNTKNLSDFQGGDGWLFVGIGSTKGVAIPKLNENNQVIGYWSNESFALQPGIAQISESNIGTRNDSIASGEQDRFISKLDAEYLKSLAKEIDADYIEGTDTHRLLEAMKAQKPARHDIAPFRIDWLIATLAGLLLLGAYISKHPIKQIKSTLKSYRKDLARQHNSKHDEIAHDNFIR